MATFDKTYYLPNNKTRHCAFCLKSIEDHAVTLCEKCRKRAYCSEECKKTDWSSAGQAHKNWCHLGCGEEDIDWKVCPVAGKGLGIVAMRPLPMLSRIMVDGGCSNQDHPGIKDLLPLDGSYDDKFYVNRIGIGDGNLKLCLRIARVNHECKPNADNWYDKTFKAVVLFAHRDIAEGEEITRNYYNFYDIGGDTSPEMARDALQTKWGIICRQDCSCYDQQLFALVTQTRELDKRIETFAWNGNSKYALELAKQLIGHQETLASSFLNKERTLYDAFQISLKAKDYRGAEKYMEGVVEIIGAVLSPESSEVIGMKIMKDLM